jgi:Na+-transporting methylmalonyl-CoA/oxaloacetate decarboxylase gamma subunit
VLLGSQMLEVGIGLVFLFLLLAVVCSSLNELIARVFALRSETLKDGISRLLADPNFEGVAKSLYDHPFIKPLEQKARPSYIHAWTFSFALLDLVAPGRRPSVRSSLRSTPQASPPS